MAASLSRYLHAMMCVMEPWAPAAACRPWALVWSGILGRNCEKIAKSDILNGERLPWAGPLWFGDAYTWLTQMSFFGREGSRTVCRNAKTHVNTDVYAPHFPQMSFGNNSCICYTCQMYRTFKSSFPITKKQTTKKNQNALLTRWIHNVKRKETSEFDIFIVAHCNKYVKCIMYYTYSMKWQK